ncbi:hydroxyisourate hydrolase [Bacteroides fragilis]|nr:hydroxyisourate hydrolase [Bacteroides fragilis]
MLKFYTEPYFLEQGLKSIYPFVEVIFRIEGKKHYHIPITMSANGYSTYRGN